MSDINPEFQDITPANKSIPTMENWYLANVVSGIEEEALPWMLAQGWEVLSTYESGSSAATAVTKYNLRRTTIQNWNVLQELLQDFTESYNEGRDANDKRYEDVVRIWTEMLDKSQTHLTEAKTELDNRVTVYLATLDELETDYKAQFSEIQSDLTGLTASLNADRTRVNEAFDAQQSQSDQSLVDRGLYSSALTSGINAGIEERRQVALTEVSEREQRLLADITLRKNEIYLASLRMRVGIIDSQMGLTNRQQDFLAYQLNERNRILTGLFGFVERRTDSYPDLGSLAQLTASLAETGAATWQSA